MPSAGEGACHRAALDAADPTAVTSGGPRLLKLVENLVTWEVDSKHQRLRPSNKTLRERVLDLLPGSLETLLFLGYREEVDAGEPLLCLDLQRHDPAAASAEGRWLRQLVLRRWQELTWGCPTCTLLNGAERQQCSLCEGPRPQWVEVPALAPAPRLGPRRPQEGQERQAARPSAAHPSAAQAGPAATTAAEQLGGPAAPAATAARGPPSAAAAAGAGGRATVEAAGAADEAAAAAGTENGAEVAAASAGGEAAAGGRADGGELEAAGAAAERPAGRPGDAYDPTGSRAVILTSGSRGDIQPIVALGLRMRDAGFRVLVLTNTNHVDFVRGLGLEAGGTRQSFARDQGGPFPTHTGQVWSEHEEVERFKPDLLVATILSYVSGTILSTVFEIPLVRLSLQPKTQDQDTEEHIWFFYNMLFGQELKRVDGRLEDKLGGGLWPSQEAFCLDEWSPIGPTLIAWPGELCARPLEWQHLTGFLVLDGETHSSTRSDSNFGGTAREDLDRFLEEGDVAPVYLGWGSMVTDSPKQMACLAVRSLKKAGLRGIILGGWAKLSAQMLRGEPDDRELLDYAARSVLWMQSAHHETLFPRCSAIVHHGGAGTCAAALRSGVPSVITPLTVDQPMNGKLISDAGYGVVTGNLAYVGKDELGAALQKCAYDRRMQARCRELAARLLREDGPGQAVAEIRRFMGEEVCTGAWLGRLQERRPCRAWRHAPPAQLAQQVAGLRGRLASGGRLCTDGGQALGSSGGGEAAQLLEPALRQELQRAAGAGAAACALRVRLPDRRAVTAELSADFTVLQVRAWLEHHHTAAFDRPYNLMDTASFPPRKLADLSATLEGLGLATGAAACLECRPA